MFPYPKIQTVFKRDPAANYKTLLPTYSLPEFEFLKDNTWEFTEKIDGANIRLVIAPDGSLAVKGRADGSPLPGPLVNYLYDSWSPPVDMFPSGACLYGEGCGAGIQKGGGRYYDAQRFVLFDVWVSAGTPTDGWWLKREDVHDIAAKLRLHATPVIGEGTIHDMVKTIQAGVVSSFGSFEAEGIVARPKIRLLRSTGERIITKLKGRDFRGTKS